MPWRRIIIRKDILTHGIILAEQQESYQITLSPSDRTTPQNVPLPRESTFLPTPTTIPQLLTLPTPFPELPHNPPNTQTRTILEAIRERLSQSQVLVLHFGEPITAFHGLNLVELPTPLVGAKEIDVSLIASPQIILSGMLLAYGRRLFIAARPLQGAHPELLLLEAGAPTRIPLPNEFENTVHPEFVEDHRIADIYLDPTVVVGFTPNGLLDPMVDCIEPSWHGFLKIQEKNGTILIMRASAIRLSMPRNPAIQGIELLPTWINFRRSGIITAEECINEISVTHAEWLGVFVPKNEMGVTPRHDELEDLYSNMLDEGFAYTYKVARGTMYMWCMHFGRLEPRKYTLAFVIVPDNFVRMERRAITSGNSVAWRGTLVISGTEFPVVAVRWFVPGRRMMLTQNWGPRLEFDSRMDARAVMRSLATLGKWGVRFLPDGNDFVLNLQLAAVGYTLMEIGKAYSTSIGEGENLADLVLFASNMEGLGIGLFGVSMEYIRLVVSGSESSE